MVEHHLLEWLHQNIISPNNLFKVKSIRKIMNIASNYKPNLYFVHIGSSEALNEILKYKRLHQDLRIWIETCPHYLTHSTDFDNIKGKVVPPLRPKDKIEKLWHSLKTGFIDTI